MVTIKAKGENGGMKQADRKEIEREIVREISVKLMGDSKVVSFAK